MHSKWQNLSSLSALQFKCWKCDNIISSEKGVRSADDLERVYFCSFCDSPTFMSFNGIRKFKNKAGVTQHYVISDNQVPAPTMGNNVNHLPDDVNAIFEEARKSTSQKNFTATVMLCRKILMHIAVEKEAKENESFLYYVNYLIQKNYVPPESEEWVDHIRKKGNEANHELVIMKQEDARDLLKFVEMILKFTYEFPAEFKKPK